ncbi:Indoleamine 2,3-dioxygenase [Thelephora ganbajun]|uniref:Indoleamine 2,3-dioxygenase n=1 Tax=Thelephora ganbajun TaxID=370292 RepID=A0ACB6ZTW3_THEGA|nr:Indoleamine 2,3-dioxygenase [Thelephora ganbajun]
MGYQWPVLSTESLEGDPRLLQRAHAVLAWLVQHYAHSTPTDGSEPIRIPKSLAVPLVRVSKILRMAPILTFADTVLWNARPRDPRRPLSMDNIQIEKTFSGTEDEENFYKASASVELRGIEAIQIIHRYLNLDDPQDRINESGLRSDLLRLKSVLEELTELMEGVKKAVDPRVFYWQVRPWFNGSGSGGGQRWVYEGVAESAVVDTSGPSAGQSAIMHAIDAFLGIDHRQLRCPIPSVRKQHGDSAFMDRMRKYMPGLHRDFLDRIDDTQVTIKNVAMERNGLREAYNGAVKALKRLRDIHIRVACLYIVSMARSEPSDGLQRRETRGLDVARGTGGNHVASLLKAGRDATQKAILHLFVLGWVSY